MNLAGRAADTGGPAQVKPAEQVRASGASTVPGNGYFGLPPRRPFVFQWAE